MTEIPIDKQALEAARRIARDHSFSALTYDEHCGLVDEAVTTYLAALPSTTDGVRVTVRELEWHPIVLGSTSSVADASFGEYTVEHYTEAATGDGWLAIYEDNRKLGYFGTEAAAKSACAEDRTARIMASLNISEAEPVAWPEPVITNPDIGPSTGIPYIDSLLHRLMDAQQDINEYANETMSQRLADASSLCDEIETVLRKLASPTTSPQAPEWVRDDVLEGGQ